MFTCAWDFAYLKYKYSVWKGDWENVDFYYEVLNDDGTKKYATHPVECVPDPAYPDYYEICSFYLGYMPDPSAYGVTENWQKRGGFRTGEGTGRGYYEGYEIVYF